LVTSNFEVHDEAIVITKADMLKIMQKPQSLTNIDEAPKVDADLAKELAKAFDGLQDLEE
jgi:hypothetical protein